MMLDELTETAAYVKRHLEAPPRVGMISGTGLDDYDHLMEIRCRLPYEDVPHFPRSTVKGHPGNLVLGRLAGTHIVALEGRFHLYEGYQPGTITFPIRLMALLGVRCVFIACAAGGLNPRLRKGSLVLITDHINLTGQNPLTGPNLDLFGPRFPDMSQAYAPELLQRARAIGLAEGIYLHEGVYVGVSGPSLETPAETRFLRAAGGDVVGMSLVHEVVAARHCGLHVLAMAVVTNVNLPDCMQPTSLEEVIATANAARPKLVRVWQGLLRALPQSVMPSLESRA